MTEQEKHNAVCIWKQCLKMKRLTEFGLVLGPNGQYRWSDVAFAQTLSERPVFSGQASEDCSDMNACWLAESLASSR